MTCGGSSVVIDGEEEREDFKAMELYLESPFNVDVDIMPPSEVEKIFRAFAEERKRALPQFTPDGIPITLENKFDDAILCLLERTIRGIRPQKRRHTRIRNEQNVP